MCSPCSWVAVAPRGGSAVRGCAHMGAAHIAGLPACVPAFGLLTVVSICDWLEGAQSMELSRTMGLRRCAHGACA